MDKRLWSNKEFNEIKERINKEILRRGTFRWNDPLTYPAVGQDRSPATEIPEDGKKRLITDKSYTINNPSDGAIIETRNRYTDEGSSLSNTEDNPNTSAAIVNLDELKNYLIGLSKIQDIKLFYGRDEEYGTAFRDPNGIEDVLISAESDELNRDYHGYGFKMDPNNGFDYKHHTYPDLKTSMAAGYKKEDGKWVMPSGEYEGEELINGKLDENNFFDDYGAEPGDGDYHPYNPAVSKIVNRDWILQGESRNRGRGPEVVKNTYGGIKSSDYGPNPRNPQKGKPYKGRPVKEGIPGTCMNMCSGLCSFSCDDQCSESCSTTCFSRCGNECSSSCGNQCSGCSGQCYSSCKSKCENTSGFACVNAGAKTVKIYTTGGKNGEPAQNHLEATYHTCTGCSYSCQFYPNKKTTCWDAGCMGKCFTSCTNSCSTSCYGGCINNASENNGDYKTGQGRGCSGGCTINCIGTCTDTCQGDCVHTCFSSCSQECSDNCSRECSTNCGSGCEQTCLNGCKDDCLSLSTNKNCKTGCVSKCQNDCNANCVGSSCTAMCGTGNSGACTNTCRLSCISSSCTSLCSDACSSTCSSCVNTCGFQCGACSSSCSTDCGAACNITCEGNCENSCSNNCVTSCTEQCSGCSNLCYSCVGACIGTCSFKCENGCTSCANQCSYWCDTSCIKECFGNCSIYCISTCSNSCVGSVSSNSNKLTNPYRNREEEQKAYKIWEKIDPYKFPEPEKKNYKVMITFNESNKLIVTNELDLKWLIYSTTNIAGVFKIDEKTGEISLVEEFFNSELNQLPEAYLTDELSFFIIKFIKPSIELNSDNLGIKLPWGFECLGPIKYKEDVVFIIKRRKVKIRKELGGDE